MLIISNVYIERIIVLCLDILSNEHPGHYQSLDILLTRLKINYCDLPTSIQS